MLLRGFLLLALLFAFPLQAEVEEDLVLGIESVTGLRTNYIYRGFELANATLEAQLETEISLDNDFSVGLAAWHIAESSGDFSETALGVNLRRDFQDFSLTASLDYRFFSETFFRDGIDLGLKGQWFINDNWDLSTKLNYDFGADGLYFAIEGGWSQPLGEDLFLSAHSGISAVNDYFDRNGLNDFYGRLSLTYNVNSFLSLSPFVGYTIGIADEASEQAYAGIWLAVSF